MDDILCLLSFFGYTPDWYREWYDDTRLSMRASLQEVPRKWKL